MDVVLQSSGTLGYWILICSIPPSNLLGAQGLSWHQAHHDFLHVYAIALGSIPEVGP